MKMEPLSDIKPAQYNPRQIAGDELEKLKKGLAEFGMVEPLVVNEDGTLIGGHQRLKAASELGWTEVPVIRVKLDKLQEKALNLALNRLSGEWDYGKLSSLLSEFEMAADFDIELTGFDCIEAVDLTTIQTVDDETLMDTTVDAGSFDGTAHTAAEPKKSKPIIQYNIIFNDEGEQKSWQAYLKWLKGQYPDMETISQRIVSDITDRMQDG
jgi:hypothetical protein